MSTLLVSTTGFASGEISFKRLKNSVTKINIRTRLIISSKDIDPSLSQMKAINSSLNNFLNQTHDYTDKSGEKFQLNFNVIAVKDSEITTDLPSDNYIDLALSGRDCASPNGLRFENYDKVKDRADVIMAVGNRATISKNSIDPYTNTISHETLHLLGLDDRYHDLILEDQSALSEEDQGFDRDIMSSRNGSFSPLHAKAFVDLVKAVRAEGKNQFYISEVVNSNVGNISKKPMYLKQVTDQ